MIPRQSRAQRDSGRISPEILRSSLKAGRQIPTNTTTPPIHLSLLNRRHQPLHACYLQRGPQGHLGERLELKRKREKHLDVGQLLSPPKPMEWEVSSYYKKADMHNNPRIRMITRDWITAAKKRQITESFEIPGECTCFINSGELCQELKEIWEYEPPVEKSMEFEQNPDKTNEDHEEMDTSISEEEFEHIIKNYEESMDTTDNEEYRENRKQEFSRRSQQSRCKLKSQSSLRSNLNSKGTP